MRAKETKMAEENANKRYSKEPCRKCGERKVIVNDVDVSGGIDYVIDCEACGDHYRIDGPDS